MPVMMKGQPRSPHFPPFIALFQSWRAFMLPFKCRLLGCLFGRRLAGRRGRHGGGRYISLPRGEILENYNHRKCRKKCKNEDECEGETEGHWMLRERLRGNMDAVMDGRTWILTNMSAPICILCPSLTPRGGTRYRHVLMVFILVLAPFKAGVSHPSTRGRVVYRRQRIH